MTRPPPRSTCGTRIVTAGYADVTFAYGAAGAGWKPIAGDWNGDGKDTMGLYDPSRSMFFLRNTTSLQGPDDKGYADVAFTFGGAGAGWLPIAGDWNGPGNSLHGGGGLRGGFGKSAVARAGRSPANYPRGHRRWAGAGLDAAALAKLAQVQFVISDLPGSYLGETEGNEIYIDSNAAGYGWFVDPTPATDEEFTTAQPRRAPSSCRPWIRRPSITSIC